MVPSKPLSRAGEPKSALGLLIALAGLSACIQPARVRSIATATKPASEPRSRASDVFNFMNLLTRHELHDVNQERWNVYGQLTWISSLKLPFSAPYTNLNGSTNSLVPSFEHSFTGTFTAYLGTALWQGAEVYWVPEVISEKPLSGLTGLGGVIQNFELQKQGSVTPTLYSSRLFFRQTFGLGGQRVTKTSDLMQLGTVVDRRRLVFTIGNFSVLDFFDKNSFSSDLRRQFFNMAFLTYAAYDFAADARGYTWGGIVELYLDDWAVRLGRVVPPLNPNQLPLDPRSGSTMGISSKSSMSTKYGDCPARFASLASEITRTWVGSTKPSRALYPFPRITLLPVPTLATDQKTHRPLTCAGCADPTSKWASESTSSRRFFATSDYFFAACTQTVKRKFTPSLRPTLLLPWGRLPGGRSGIGPRTMSA